MNTTKSKTEYLLVRVTDAGKLSFYRGDQNSDVISDHWTTDRSKAYLTENLPGLEALQEFVPRNSNKKDRLLIVPEYLIGAITRWYHDERARERREHREQRLRTQVRQERLAALRGKEK